jgi:HAE1 family hydrophobic/amphiphilic exporter-1
VIPSLAARMLTTVKKPKGVESSSAWNTSEFAESGLTARRPSGLERIKEALGSLVYGLSGSVFWRSVTILGFTSLAIVGSWALLPKAEYLPQGNRNLVIGILLPPPGYNTHEFVKMGQPIESTLSPYWDAKPGSPEEAALDGPSIANFFYVARGRSVFMGGRVNEPDRVKELIPLFRRATADLPGVIGIITQRGLFERGLGEGRNINIEITGPELDTLVELGGQVFGQVKGVLPEAQVRPIPSLDLGSPEVRVTVKRDRAADVQMTNQELGFTIDALVDGAKASDYQFEGDEIDLTIRGIDRYANQTQSLTSIPIYTKGGQLTTVGNIADVTLVAGPEQINHIERERSIVIQVIPPVEMALEEAMDVIRTQILGPLKEGGTLGRLYNVRLSGTADDLTETYEALKWNFLLAFTITYLLMAALFESFLYPLVIIFTVPFAAAGGFLGLSLVNNFVAYQPLDVLTMLGFVILIGVVVNNAILVVHQALNFMRGSEQADSLEGVSEQGLSIREAIRESVKIRVRPIMMTTLTTLFGLFPLVVSSGAGSELYRGIGSVVLGGLMVSTVFTLIVIPALFTLVMDAQRKWKEARKPQLTVQPSVGSL